MQKKNKKKNQQPQSKYATATATERVRVHASKQLKIYVADNVSYNRKKKTTITKKHRNM